MLKTEVVEAASLVGLVSVANLMLVLAVMYLAVLGYQLYRLNKR